ncbi:MAG: 50S ribosomal protein P1 [Nanoarchaeota archaeon]
MEYIHTALLLNKLGKPVNEANVKKVLEAAGAHVEEAKVKALVTSLEGVDMEKVIKEASVMPIVTVAAPQAGAQEAKKEEKKDDKKSEEAAAAGLGALFG